MTPNTVQHEFCSLRAVAEIVFCVSGSAANRTLEVTHRLADSENPDSLELRAHGVWVLLGVGPVQLTLTQEVQVTTWPCVSGTQVGSALLLQHP